MVKERTIFSTILKHLDSSEILLLNGPRQVGKTTLLKLVQDHLYAQHVSPDHMHWFDLERVEHLGLWSDQTTALQILPLATTDRHYIFIDEFQQSKHIGSILKVIHDHYPQFKIILTGSASWYLNIGESMAGRKRIIPIWPLTFEEFLQWNYPDLIEYYTLAQQAPLSFPAPLGQSVNHAYQEYCTYGGYPAVVLASTVEGKQAILSELINSYLLKDIQLWHYRANTVQVKQLLTLLANQVSSQCEVNTLSTNTGLGRTALLNRLELLQQTFMVHTVRPYFTNRTKEIVKQPKVYMVDNGLRNSLMQQFALLPQTDDFGYAVENAVVQNLSAHATPVDRILYWRTKQQQEVDCIFVQNGAVTPIEIKSGSIEHIPSPLKSFIQLYTPKEAYVLNWSVVKDQLHNGCQIHFRPLWFPISSPR